jgi:multicomponent Na+:H+ antiporter subunit G
MLFSLETLAGLFFFLGILSVVIGALGLVRLPDVYARIHAAGIIDTAGVTFFILGMICLSGWSLVTVKLVLIGVFLFFTSPISGHAIAKVALECGIKPLGRDLTSGQIKSVATPSQKKTASKKSSKKKAAKKKSAAKRVRS